MHPFVAWKTAGDDDDDDDDSNDDGPTDNDG